nr:hypothetical protein [Actinomycetota bacterium]
MNRRVFIVMAMLGWGVMAFGVLGLFHNSARTHPGEWVKWFLGGALVHDAVLAPVVFGVALLLGRVPRPWKASLQGGLVAAAVVTLTVYPFLRGYGRRSDNLSVLPNDYSSGLIRTLAVIAVVTAGFAAGAWWRGRKSGEVAGAAAASLVGDRRDEGL